MPHGRRWLFLILTGYVLMTLAYGAINPLFEAPDEHWHYFTVQYIKDNQALPAVTDPYDTWMAQEAAQPPLFYVLGAALITPINTTHARSQVWLNPFFYAGDAARLTDVNQVVHTPAEAWPWTGVWLAAHVLRAFSTLCGLGTLVCVYGCGRLLWPDDARHALLATALVAFLPQYNFVHASISNDPLIIFLCSFALWQVLWMWLHDGQWPRLLLLGITCGLAALTKNAGTLLLVYTAGVLFLCALKHPSKRALLAWWGRTAVFVILPALLITGWLWWRNQQLYGDFTATEPFIRLAHGDRDYTLLQVLAETGGLVRSAVAVFGWFNVLAPTWVYGVWGGLVLTAVLGAVKGLKMRGWRSTVTANKPSPISFLQASWFPALLLGGWFLLVYAGLLLFMLRTPAAQGRLLFPAIVPLALALAGGLGRWGWREIYRLPPLLALLTTLGGCFLVIRPAYAPPPVVATLPDHAAPLETAVGQGLMLHAAAAEPATAVPGDTRWFTFYWTADPVPATPPELVVELFGRDLALVGKSHTYHGQGRYPANLWPAGEIIADRVGIRLTETVAAPVLARLFVRLAPGEGSEGMQVGEVKIVPAAWPLGGQALAQIGAGIEVTAVTLRQDRVQPGDILNIDITWQVQQPPGADLTTLVHLAAAGQPPLATGDDQPLAGQYPTRVWAPGEVIADHYAITIPADLPPGRYPIWIGLYNAATGERQPVTIDDQRQLNDVLLIGYVNVGD